MLSRTERVICLIVLAGAAVITLYPMVVLVTTAFSPLNSGSGGISFAHPLSLSAFSYAWRAGGFSRYMLNTVIVTGAVVLISAVIPWAVYTRYVVNRAASWPEPMAVLLMIVLTFFGAAACYRVRLHMRVSFFVSLLPSSAQQVMALLVELLMALVALFMVNWGIKLVAATWQNSIADFPSLSVGATYLPIPIGGAILLLFVIERVMFGAAPDAETRRSG